MEHNIQYFLFNLADRCLKDENRFASLNTFLAGATEEDIKYVYKDNDYLIPLMLKLSEMAKRDFLKTYFQNVMVMA